MSKHTQRSSAIALTLASLAILLGFAIRINAATKPAQADTPHLDAALKAAARKQSLKAIYAGLPLMFERADNGARFVARTPGMQLMLEPAAVRVLVAHPTGKTKTVGAMIDDAARRRGTMSGPSWTFREYEYSSIAMKFTGANPSATITGVGQSTARANYLIGNDPKHWRTAIPTYSKVEVAGLYPGIDLSYYGHGGSIEYDLRVKPGADPRKVRLSFEGGSASLNRDGDLMVAADGRPTPLVLRKPVVYQERGGRRIPIDGHYVLKSSGAGSKGSPSSASFEVSNYDHSLPLTIDPTVNSGFPTVVYNVLVGGSDNDQPADGQGSNPIAIDTSGDTYVTGLTLSPDFPTTAGSFQPTKPSTTAGNANAFVFKLNPVGNLVYSTFLGGSGIDAATGIAVDVTGNTYVTGGTNSTNFPVTSGAAQKTLPGIFNGFVTGLSADGSSLLFSTYLGGSASEGPSSIAFQKGITFVTGFTGSSNFPTTSGAFQQTAGGNGDAFVTEFNASGGILDSTFVGGNNFDNGFGIALDSIGNAYVTGTTNSTNFPTSPGAFQTTNPKGSGQGFVTILKPDLSGIIASTLFGSPSGTGLGTNVFSLALSPQGIAIVGSTDAPDLAVTNGTTRTTSGFSTNAFVGVLSLDLTKETGGGYLGGSGRDSAASIALNPLDNTAATVVGGTTSVDFAPRGPGQRGSTALFSSPDGTNFAPFDNGITGNVVDDVAVDPTNPNIIYCATSHGVFKTLDHSNFTRISPSNQEFSTIAVDPANPSNVYAGIIQNFQTDIYKSVDGGNTFTTVNTGIFGLRFQNLSFNPAIPGEIDGVVKVFDTGQVVQSVDNGKTFQKVTTPTKDSNTQSDILGFIRKKDGTIIALDGKSGIVQVKNGTGSLINGNETGNVISGNSIGIFVGGNANQPGHTSAVQISTDFGNTFVDSPLPAVAGNVYGLGATDSFGGGIYAVTDQTFAQTGQIWKFANGNTWTQVSPDSIGFDLSSQGNGGAPPLVEFTPNFVLIGGPAAENGFNCFFNLPNVTPTKCTRFGDYSATYEPSVAFDQNGNAYISYLTWGPGTPSVQPPGSHSVDGIVPSASVQTKNNAYPVGANIGVVVFSSGSSATPTATSAATPSPTPTAAATPTSTSTSAKTATPTTTGTAAKTSTPTATATGSPVKTATATPTATSTSTAMPTPTPVPVVGSIKILPPHFNFGKVFEGDSKAKTFMIKNTSKKKTGVKVLIETEMSSSSLFMLSNLCMNKQLAPNESCPVTVTFVAPMDTATHTGNLIVDDNLSSGPTSAQLTGTGKVKKTK